jgi:hypothetical protein
MCRQRRPIPFGSLVKMARKAESARQFGELRRQRYARNAARNNTGDHLHHEDALVDRHLHALEARLIGG